jgi:2-haloacid dehalogenase
MTQADGAPIVRTMLFDVLGTIVDERGSIDRECAAALADAGIGAGAAQQLAAAWEQRMDRLRAEVTAGIAPWRPNDALRRESLHEAAAALGLAGLPAGLLDDLALAGERLRPWPDSPAALRSLSAEYTVVALSNATLAELTGLSAAGGLAWHCVLSAALTRAYKPDPAVYQMALDLLQLNPEQTMLVAAHPWDLRAAAGHGMRTAYISRPGQGTPSAGDQFDVYATDLAGLAAAVTGGVPSAAPENGATAGGRQ